MSNLELPRIKPLKILLIAPKGKKDSKSNQKPLFNMAVGGICQQRCRRFIKKIIQLYPGLRLLPGSHSIA